MKKPRSPKASKPAKTASPRKPKDLCCVAEFPLGTTAADERVIDKRLEAARHIGNTCVDESLKRLRLMRESRDWQRARAMPRHLGTDAKGKPIANPERTALFKAVIARFDFTAASIQKHAERCRDNCWIGGHLASHDTQTTSKRAFSAVQQYAFSKRGRPRFKGQNRVHSIEGKGNAVIILRQQGKKWVVRYNGLVLPLVLDPKDKHGWQAEMLVRPVKYVRILRRRIKSCWRPFAQIVVEGAPYQKPKNPLGPPDSIVGLDIGPSTIAVVSEADASLTTFCPRVEDFGAHARRMQRAMDRSRRATNAHCFEADGTWKKGERITTRSSRYRELQDELAETERRLASERKRAHGELANQVLALGKTIQTERLSYRSFQKNFGRSVKRRAPEMFVSLLSRKAESAGGTVVVFGTRHTRLSQFDHQTGTFEKKPLSQRWHVFSDGSRVQRDLYSAWLARFVQGNRLDASKEGLALAFGAVEPLLGRAASGLDGRGYPCSSATQAASGRGFAAPHVGVMPGVGAARSPKRVGCARGPLGLSQQPGGPIPSC